MSNSIFSIFASTPAASEETGGVDLLAPQEPLASAGPEAPLNPAEVLSILLISPDEERNAALCRQLDTLAWVQVHTHNTYPRPSSEAARMSRQHDAVIVDLDGPIDLALEIVEKVSQEGNATVMVISAEATPDKLMRSMRAGAREFLNLPPDLGSLEEALGRAFMRRPARQTKKKAAGKLLTFMGAKGGVGVTTLACNFALAAAQQPDMNTLLVDLAIPLGDVALNLDTQSEFSTVNALRSADRLDTSLLSKLLVKHKSGLSILGAHGEFVPDRFTNDAIAKLLAVARQSFDYVVVDAGSRLDLTDMSLFRDASVIYLVAQVGVAELRNSNRLISQTLAGVASKIEIVLNRYNPKSTEVPEDYIAKVLTKTPRWKIPNDYASVQKVQIDSAPLVPGASPIARAIQEMAAAITGQAVPKPKKTGFALFR